uniref:B9 domain-containing protein 1 n=1 Tax=Ascaris lumbricoides TaxID=6252 RepID=A0A0M3IRX5_ASCLU
LPSIFQFPSLDNCYCKYSYVYGNDWEQVSGLEEGLSARCERAPKRDCIVIGLPIEATFTSTNPFRCKWYLFLGHNYCYVATEQMALVTMLSGDMERYIFLPYLEGPQLLLCCYGTDGFGNDVVRGYGAVHIPTVPGRSVRHIAMFVPEASTTVQKFFGWITGKRAEFIDPRIVAYADRRHVTRVRSQGFINVTMNIVLKDLKKYGYDVTSSSLLRISEFPLPKFDTKSTVDKPSTSADDSDTRKQPPKKEDHMKEQMELQPETSAQVEPQSSSIDAPRPLPKPRRRSQPAREQQIVEELDDDENHGNT